MHVLIVHAHPEPRSFGAALVRQAQQTLSAVDATVTVSDLYAMNWEPRSARRNFTTILDPGVFRQQAEEQFASDHHGFGPDIAAELTKLQACDLLILQFPLWWFAMPAILKGWVDRGDFRGRRAMLCLTTGGPTSMYKPGRPERRHVDAALPDPARDPAVHRVRRAGAVRGLGAGA